MTAIARALHRKKFMSQLLYKRLLFNERRYVRPSMSAWEPWSM